MYGMQIAQGLFPFRHASLLPPSVTVIQNTTIEMHRGQSVTAGGLQIKVWTLLRRLHEAKKSNLKTPMQSSVFVVSEV